MLSQDQKILASHSEQAIARMCQAMLKATGVTQAMRKSDADLEGYKNKGYLGSWKNIKHRSFAESVARQVLTIKNSAAMPAAKRKDLTYLALTTYLQLLEKDSVSFRQLFETQVIAWLLWNSKESKGQDDWRNTIHDWQRQNYVGINPLRVKLLTRLTAWNFKHPGRTITIPPFLLNENNQYSKGVAFCFSQHPFKPAKVFNAVNTSSDSADDKKSDNLAFQVSFNDVYDFLNDFKTQYDGQFKKDSYFHNSHFQLATLAQKALEIKQYYEGNLSQFETEGPNNNNLLQVKQFEACAITALLVLVARFCVARENQSKILIFKTRDTGTTRSKWEDLLWLVLNNKTINSPDCKHYADACYPSSHNVHPLQVHSRDVFIKETRTLLDSAQEKAYRHLLQLVTEFELEPGVVGTLLCVSDSRPLKSYTVSNSH